MSTCWPDAGKGAQLTAATPDALNARIDLLAIIVQELGRALAPDAGASVLSAVRQRVLDLAAGGLEPPADEAITLDLMALEEAMSG